MLRITSSSQWFLTFSLLKIANPVLPISSYNFSVILQGCVKGFLPKQKENPTYWPACTYCVYTISVPSETTFCCHQSSVPKTANSSQPVSCQLSLELAQKELLHINNLANVSCCTKKELNTVSFVTRLIVWVIWMAVRNIWTQDINPIARIYRHQFSKVASKPTSTRTAVHQNIYSLQIM